MPDSLICLYEDHVHCNLVNCACACHVTFKDDTLRSIEDLIERLSPVFPDADDLTGPPVIKALNFVSEAVRLYCTVPISMVDARSLVKAERTLTSIICTGMYTLEVDDDKT